MNNTYADKKKALKKLLASYAKENLILAFSGGVDSSLLLKMCVEASQKTGKKVYGVTAHTSLHPSADLDIAKRVCQEAGAEHIIVHVDELLEAGIERNPINRCYLCKRCIFAKIKELSVSLGISLILEGTNEDDLHVYRPGIQALKELSIISPLAICGITKEEVRKLAAEYDISVADRPSTPCMATRFPYGSLLDYGELKKVEMGEDWLRSRGYYNVRLRVHGDIARIEVDEKDLSKIVEERNDIILKMKELGYAYVTIDLEGFRSGSMDVNIKQ